VLYKIVSRDTLDTASVRFTLKRKNITRRYVSVYIAVVTSAIRYLGPPNSIALLTFAAIKEATELPLGGQVLQSLAVSFVAFRLLHK